MLSRSQLFVIAVVVTGCSLGKGRDKKDSHEEENVPTAGGVPTLQQTDGTSFLMSTKGALPPCNGGHEGNLAYVTDESLFYACSAEKGEWVVVDIKGPVGPQGAPGAPGTGDGGAAIVYSGDGSALGKLAFVNEGIGIVFSDGAIGRFDPANGHAMNGVCAGTTSLECNVDYYPCSFATNDCTGACYVWHKPYKNSIFPAGPNLFLKSTGRESKSSVAIDSFWRRGSVPGDFGSCVSTSGGIINGYAVSEYYSFPAGITYPFPGADTDGLTFSFDP